MVAILDLTATLAKMPTMHGRRPESTEALLDELVARRLAARTAGGAVALVAA